MKCIGTLNMVLQRFAWKRKAWKEQLRLKPGGGTIHEQAQGEVAAGPVTTQPTQAHCLLFEKQN